MDRIFFGDNQFFGVNHMSEEKARQQLMRFQSIDAVADTLYARVPGRRARFHVYDARTDHRADADREGRS